MAPSTPPPNQPDSTRKLIALGACSLMLLSMYIKLTTLFSYLTAALVTTGIAAVCALLLWGLMALNRRYPDKFEPSSSAKTPRFFARPARLWDVKRAVQCLVSGMAWVLLFAAAGGITLRDTGILMGIWVFFMYIGLYFAHLRIEADRVDG